MVHALQTFHTRYLATTGAWLRVGALLCALIAGLLVVVTRATSAAAGAPARLVGSAAPTLVLPAEQHGNLLPGTVSLRAYRGHPVLVVFFFTLCVHCLGELQTVHTLPPTVAALGVRIVYVDSPGEAPQTVDAYMVRVGVTAPTLLDAQARAAKRFNIAYYPAIVLLDSQSIVRAAWVGDTSAAALVAGIRALPGG